MNWQAIISAIFSVIAIMISLLNFRLNRDIQKAKELKEQFDTCNEELDELKKTVDHLLKEFNRVGIIEERMNNEIAVSSKYRDKFEVKLDEIIRITYAQK